MRCGSTSLYIYHVENDVRHSYESLGICNELSNTIRLLRRPTRHQHAQSIIAPFAWELCGQLFNFWDELAYAERLAHDIVHTSCKKCGDLLASCVGRDGDNGNVALQGTRSFELADFAGALQTVHNGHFFVHENDANVTGIGAGVFPIRGLAKTVEGFATVVCDLRGYAVVLQLATQDLLVH